jgi:hemerythrin-like domain-containing protein
MSKAIDTLMNEHRVIEKVMNALETLVGRVQAGQPVERQTISQFAAFFKNFADKCHHGKEEDLLFAKLIEHGFPRDQGPLAVMFFEHQAGRSHVGALGEIGIGSEPLSEAEKEQFILNANGFVSLLQNHILKEDRILYPLALESIPVDEMERLAKQFDEFETKVMGAGAHQEFHKLADTLIASFPPQGQS